MNRWKIFFVHILALDIQSQLNISSTHLCFWPFFFSLIEASYAFLLLCVKDAFDGRSF